MVMSPALFNIQRLKDTDETDVDFSFYIETRQGPPEYLGRKTYERLRHSRRA